jgi:zinc/manganese transport system substrate-binding protein
MKINLFLILILFVVITTQAQAGINVVATYGYLADITAKIGRENITVTPMAQGNRDPHTIVPRPSLLARLRTADLLIINGAHLEIGWVPPLLGDANNRSIQPGQPGFS